MLEISAHATCSNCCRRSGEFACFLAYCAVRPSIPYHNNTDNVIIARRRSSKQKSARKMATTQGRLSESCEEKGMSFGPVILRYQNQMQIQADIRTTQQRCSLDRIKYARKQLTGTLQKTLARCKTNLEVGGNALMQQASDIIANLVAWVPVPADFL